MAVRASLTVAALWWFTRVVRRIDWSQVGAALLALTAAEVLLLLAVVAARQVLNAAPLALFVPGLGLRRAMANDMSANLVATVAPPPADLALRISMFRSWDVEVTAGMGGLTLNTLTFYVARFGAPLLGLAVALATGLSEPAFVATALLSGAVSLVVVAALVLATRGEERAARVVRGVAGQVSRVRARVDPEAWALRARHFVATLAERIRSRGLTALACQVGLVLSEALLLLVSLRVAGVPAGVASAAAVLVALLISYPLTALPFAGVGVLDASVLAILHLSEGPWEAKAIAGMVIFRACWVMLPLVLGGVTVLAWRRTSSSRATGRPSAGASEGAGATRGVGLSGGVRAGGRGRGGEGDVGDESRDQGRDLTE